MRGLPMNSATSSEFGIGVDRPRCRDLEKAALHHHGDAVRHRHRFGLVVRYIDQRRAEAAMQLGQLAAHVDTQIGVEIR